MKISLVVSIGFFCLAILQACSSGYQSDKQADSVSLIPARGNTDARGFEIAPFEGGADLIILDPWNARDTFANYHIVFGDTDWQRWAVFSTTHIGFLDALGESDRVIGCTTPDRIYNKGLYEKYKAGNLIRIGSDMEYNFESLMDQHPDLVIQTGFAGQKTKDARIINSGINLVYVMEWLEPTPLGRAEWIRVFGLLLNKSKEADSIFSSIRHEYLYLCDYIAEVSERPEVFVGNNYRGTWFMPGGKNYMSRFLQDAGFSYPYLNSNESGSLPLSFETVIHQFGRSPVWLGVSAESLKELVAEDERYKLFEAYRNQLVYSLSNRVIRDLGNDFWEAGVINPQEILKDLITIAHPDLFPEHELTYYKKLR